MGNPLWAPWRMEYILAPKKDEGCIFCGVAAATAEERRARLVVASNPDAFVMLNKFPFAAGHLLVVPHAHVASLEELSDADNAALFSLVRAASSRLSLALKPHGMNIGLNLGTAAGSSVTEHLHVQIVPRWAGDTNFMPVLADTRVIPQALEQTRDHLASHFADLDTAGGRAVR